MPRRKRNDCGLHFNGKFPARKVVLIREGLISYFTDIDGILHELYNWEWDEMMMQAKREIDSLFGDGANFYSYLDDEECMFMYMVKSGNFKETFARLCPGKDMKTWLKSHIYSYDKESGTFYDYSECCTMDFEEWFADFVK